MTTKTRKRRALSFSQTEALSCPFRYERVKISKEHKEPRTAPMAFGGLLHDFSELYWKSCVKMGEGTDLGGVKVLLRKAWDGQEKPIILTPDHADEALELAEKFAETHLVDPVSFIGAEVKVALDGDFRALSFKDPREWMWNKKIFWRAIIDRVDQHPEFPRVAVITDYKSSWKIGSANPFQNKSYCLAVDAVFPGQFDEFHTQVDYIRHGVVTDPEVYTLDDIEDVKKKIVAFSDQVERRIDDNDWPALAGSWCEHCTIPNCPIDSQQGTDPEELAAQLRRLELRVKQTKERLQDHAAAEGPIAVGDGAYGYGVSKSPRIETGNWIEGLRTIADNEERMAALAATMKVDARAAKKILKAHPAMAEIVTVGEKASTSFKFRKLEG